jgi:hypothetical protein
VVRVGPQRLPFLFLEEHAARQLGGLPPLVGEIQHPPGDYQVQCQAGLEIAGLGQAPIFDAAAALEGAVKDLDIPSLTPL